MDVKVFTAPRAGESGEPLEKRIGLDLVRLTERLVTSKRAVSETGALGGRYGYGARFENEVFRMRQFCWCEKPDCATCADQSWDTADGPRPGAPHFEVFGTPIEVRWYKWIGRSMEVAPADLSAETWAAAFERVLASVGGPQRVQMSRRKGARLPEGAVVVARPTKWGNPFTRDELVSVVELVAKYRQHLEARLLTVTVDDVRRELRGLDLACWCPIGQPCHADVLLEVANG